MPKTRTKTQTKTMSAADFKAKCLDVLDQVAERREPVVVTKRGKPVAQVVPIVNRPKHLWGAMKGELEIRGTRHPARRGAEAWSGADALCRATTHYWHVSI